MSNLILINSYISAAAHGLIKHLQSMLLFLFEACQLINVDWSFDSFTVIFSALCCIFKQQLPKVNSN